MATLITSNTGYISTATLSGTTESLYDANNNRYTDIYYGNTGMSKPPIGIIEFNQSINNLLGTAASDWNNLEFSSVILTLKKGAFHSGSETTTNFSIGAGIESLTNRVNSSLYKLEEIPYVTHAETGHACSRNEPSQGEIYFIFDLTSFFNNIPQGKNSFLPSSSTWRIYIQHPNNYMAARGFARKYMSIRPKEGYNTTITIEGRQKSGLGYTADGINWQKCQVNYYDGSNNWRECEVKYWDGNDWIPVGGPP